MDMNVTAAIPLGLASQVQRHLDLIAQLEAERAALEARAKAQYIASMNRPHLVARRWIRMQLIWLFN